LAARKGSQTCKGLADRKQKQFWDIARILLIALQAVLREQELKRVGQGEAGGREVERVHLLGET